LQVSGGTALLGIFLAWAAGNFPWVAMRAHSAQRAGLMALLLLASGAIYFAALWAAGLKVREFVTH
jgi:putative peptidoglycan lipid II flippase